MSKAVMRQTCQHMPILYCTLSGNKVTQSATAKGSRLHEMPDPQTLGKILNLHRDLEVEHETYKNIFFKPNTQLT